MAKAKVRKLPIRSRKVSLDGDFEDWEWEFRTNPALGRWAEAAALASSFDEDDPSTHSNAVKGMLQVLETVLISWNFVDEEGNDLPATIEGLSKLPLELLSLMFAKVNEGVAEAPLVSSSS